MKLAISKKYSGNAEALYIKLRNTILITSSIKIKMCPLLSYIDDPNNIPFSIPDMCIWGKIINIIEEKQRQNSLKR